MRYYSDSHIHSTYTQHPSMYYSTMVQQAQKAVELGLCSITITEHLDVDDLLGPKCGYIPHLPMEAYHQEYLEVKEAFCRELDVRFGVEIGLMDGAMEETVEILKDWAFDFKIASVHHFKNSFDYSDRTLWEQHPELSKVDGMLAYLSAIRTYGEQLGDFDVIGHLTYLSRMCPWEDPEIRYGDAPEEIDAFLKWVIGLGRGIEINGGYLERLGFLIPGLDIVTRYRELGGEILTIGSDAHGAEGLGLGLHEGMDLAAAAGFRYYTTFHRRMPMFHKL